MMWCVYDQMWNFFFLVLFCNVWLFDVCVEYGIVLFCLVVWWYCFVWWCFCRVVLFCLVMWCCCGGGITNIVWSSNLMLLSWGSIVLSVYVMCVWVSWNMQRWYLPSFVHTALWTAQISWSWGAVHCPLHCGLSPTLQITRIHRVILTHTCTDRQAGTDRQADRQSGRHSHTLLGHWECNTNQQSVSRSVSHCSI